MIITMDYARRLIRRGDARIVTLVLDNGRYYVAIDRLDCQRVDHYPASKSEIVKGV